MGSGLSYPCLPPTGFPFGVGKCPILGSPNATSFSFTSGVCTAVGGAVGATPAPLAGFCQVAAAGTVSGWCGAATGQGNMALTVMPLTGPSRTYVVPFTFQVGGTTVVGSGTTGSLPPSIAVTVDAQVTAVPTAAIPLLTNSCVSKTAINFTVAGKVTAIATP